MGHNQFNIQQLNILLYIFLLGLRFFIWLLHIPRLIFHKEYIYCKTNLILNSAFSFYYLLCRLNSNWLYSYLLRDILNRCTNKRLLNRYIRRTCKLYRWCIGSRRWISNRMLWDWLSLLRWSCWRRMITHIWILKILIT